MGRGWRASLRMEPGCRSSALSFGTSWVARCPSSRPAVSGQKWRSRHEPPTCAPGATPCLLPVSAYGEKSCACVAALCRKCAGVRILVAEDETIIRLDLRDLLEQAGHEVCGEARDGVEAVELARELEPDLAVMDVK